MQHWLSARQKWLRHLKTEVRAHLGREDAELKGFRQRFSVVLRQRWRRSNREQLFRALRTAKIIYGADFHAFQQVQRTHLRILRSLPESEPMTLALECFTLDAQKHIDRYLRGRLSKSALKELTQWEMNWGFSWEAYMSLVDLAKKRGWPVLALNRPQEVRLRRREIAAADVIVQHHHEHPHRRVYVVFGEWHLAPQHLPKFVSSKLALGKGEELTVLVNSEKIYFSLAKRHLESEVEVVRIANSMFCVLSSPPWVQWHHYLQHLQATQIAGSDEEHEVGDEVLGQIEWMARDLNLADLPSAQSWFRWQVNSGRRLSRMQKKSFSKAELRIVQEALADGRIVLVPHQSEAWLPQASSNQIAELAGQIIHTQQAQRRRILCRFPQDFMPLIWVEAVGFFMSQLVNHKRATNTLSDLTEKLQSQALPGAEKEALVLAVKQRLREQQYLRSERWRALNFVPRRKSSYFRAARILGTMMGERLYLQYRRRKLPLRWIHSALQIPVESKGFAIAYQQILRRLGPRLEGRRSQQVLF